MPLLLPFLSLVRLIANDSLIRLCFPNLFNYLEHGGF